MTPGVALVHTPQPPKGAAAPEARSPPCLAPNRGLPNPCLRHLSTDSCKASGAEPCSFPGLAAAGEADS